MISGDIILKGQGTKSQALIPVMAKPPETTSDITLKEWLQEVRFGKKGIRLHIHSPEALDISLQVLNDFNKQVVKVLRKLHQYLHILFVTSFFQ